MLYPSQPSFEIVSSHQLSLARKPTTWSTFVHFSYQASECFVSFLAFRSRFSFRRAFFTSLCRCLDFLGFVSCFSFVVFFGAFSGWVAFDGLVASMDSSPIISSSSEDSLSDPELAFASVFDVCFDDCPDCSDFLASIDALSCARAFSFAFCSFRSVSILSFPA